MKLLEIKNLHAKIEDKEILKGINLTLQQGEVHAIMGPNGSGKSTLAQVISGRSEYEVTEGEVLLNGENILEMAPEERACKGLFMAFQYPVEIPGVTNSYFLRAALNAKRKFQEKPGIDALEFMGFIKEKIKLLELDPSLLSRSVNEGFSGGEKKRNEIVQLAVLEPVLSILDETDSGLDIDALKVVSAGVNAMRSAERSFVVVTHYQRLLNYIVPDYVHILMKGQIVRSGGKELAMDLESSGYGFLEDELMGELASRS